MTTTTRPDLAVLPQAPAAGHVRGGAWQAFRALLLRDVRVVAKNLPTFILRTIMQPLLFTFVFAYVFPKIGQGIGLGSSAHGGINFATILVPGLIAVSVNFQGVQAVALPLVQEFSYSKEIEDRVLAPLPVWGVGVGKIVAGALQAVLAAFVVFPIVLVVHAHGQGPTVHISNWGIFIGTLVLASLMSGSFGLFIGSAVDPRQVSLIFALLILPMTLLGCIYYPWSALHSIRWLQIAVLVNPIVYMSEAFRAALTPTVPHMNPYAFFSAMVALTVIFGGLGLRAFYHRVVS